MTKRKRSKNIKLTWITFAGVVLAAIIGVVFAPRPHIGNIEQEKESQILHLLELTYSITGLHNSDGEWKEVPIWDNVSLYSGDCFKISFKTNEDCFIYVFLYGSGGIAQCLFPHKKIDFDNDVRGDLLYTLPDGDNWYYLDDKPGVETIYIVACYKPMNNLARLLREMEQADSHRQLALSEDIRRGISDVQTRGLESNKYVFSQRGVSKIAPNPTWSLSHEGNVIKAVTEVVRGTGSVVKIVSFKHK